MWRQENVVTLLVDAQGEKGPSATRTPVQANGVRATSRGEAAHAVTVAGDLPPAQNSHDAL